MIVNETDKLHQVLAPTDDEPSKQEQFGSQGEQIPAEMVSDSAANVAIAQPNSAFGNPIQVQTLNLPKGGGAIRGIGEKLQVNEMAGSATLSLPITLTSCRDFTPGLGLSYVSSVGNGAWGLGVQSSLPSIVRSTQQGVPRYDQQDIFLLTGADYLMPVAGQVREEVLNTIPYQIQTYQPCIEGLYALIEYWQVRGAKNAHANFWRVITADHIVQVFGLCSQAKIYDANDPNHVFEWLLEEAYDAKGQHQLYQYKAENLDNVPLTVCELNRSQTANRYLERIYYGNDVLDEAYQDQALLFIDAEAPQSLTTWHFEAVFDYGEYEISSKRLEIYKPVRNWLCRPDSFSTYTAGFEIRTHRLCRNVLMFHRFPDAFNQDEPLLVHVTQYHYETSAVAKLSQLVRVNSTGYYYQLAEQRTEADDYYKTASLPAVVLQYQQFNPTEPQFLPLKRTNDTALSGVNEPPYYQLIDLFGEGIPGIFYSDGQTTSYQNPLLEDKLTTYQPPRNLSLFPNVQQLQTGFASFMDINASGNMDVVVTGTDLRGYYAMQSDKTGWQPFKPFAECPTDLQAVQQRWVDITGNGLADLVQLNDKTIRVYPAKRSQGWAKAYEETVPADFPNTLTSSSTTLVQFADLAGSGLPQLVRIRNGEVCYWPSLGYGRFGQAVFMENVPKFDEEATFNTDRLFIVDVDGSGVSDLVYLMPGKAVLYVNQSGNRFHAPIEIALPAAFDNLDQIQFVDLSGNGTTGLLLSLTHTTQEPQYYYADLCHYKKPYLLNKIDNQYGAITEIEYASSTQFYFADQKAGRPWLTKLPFPVPVIAKITTRDELSCAYLTQVYSYHHGYYDGVEREFRGFGLVERQDTEHFTIYPDSDAHYVAPAKSKTWYCLGVKDNTLSRQLSHEYYQGDQQAFVFPDSVIEAVATMDEITRYQAYRALKGCVLRTELYGLDNTAQAACPYTVTETNYGVRLKQAKAENAYAVFEVHTRESMTYNYERVPNDPQIQQQLNLEVDHYGQVTRAAMVAYPRRGEVTAEFSAQQKLRISCTTTEFVHQTSVDKYLLGVAVQSRQYHIHELEPLPQQAFSLEYLKQAIDDYLQELKQTQQVSSAKASLFGWQRMHYAKVTANQTLKLPVGEVALPLLPMQQVTAALSQTQTAQLFSEVLTAEELSEQLKAGYYSIEVAEFPDYWWSVGNTQHYYADQGFYAAKVTVNPAEGQTSYTYDPHFLTLLTVTDPLNNQICIEQFDYQLLQPRCLKDINDNCSEVSFDALGRVIYSTQYGHEQGQSVGFAPIAKAPRLAAESIQDILAAPATFLGDMASYFYYDDFAWVNHQTPATVVQLTATCYPNQSLADSATIHIAVSYADGFGRALQNKIKAEGGLAFIYESSTGTVESEQQLVEWRWLTSGCQVYNNKGNAVKTYEPYYINVPDYISDPVLNTFGVTPTLYYDPLSRVIKVLTAKGFITKSTWTAWEAKDFDENDAILEAPYYWANNPAQPEPSSPYYDPAILPAEQAALAYAAKYFANTPSTTVIDNLGNAIVTEQINQYPDPQDKELTVTQYLRTYYEYDDSSRLVRVCDPRLAEREERLYNYVNLYNTLAGPALKTISLDAGTRWILVNGFGQPLFSYDSRQISILMSYDPLQRLLTRTVKKSSSPDDPLVLDNVVECFIYGESIANAKDHNLRGQLYRQYDTAGMLTTPSFSLLGAALKTQRRFRLDYQQEVNWPAEELAKEALLQPTDCTYTQSWIYDALGRTIQATACDNTITMPSYHLSGRLNQLQVTTADDQRTTMLVQGIDYDAKGQRTGLRLGSKAGTVLSTYYSYESATWRLRTINSSNEAGGVLQALQYQYDPVGNVIAKADTAQASQFYKNQQIEPASSYQYDALYQLIEAQGRQAAGRNKGEAGIDILPISAQDLKALENYTARYNYDRAGNLLLVQHQAGTVTRNSRFIVSDCSNRAVSETIKGKDQPEPTPAQVETYFDRVGNQISLHSLHPLDWDYRNQLQKVTTVRRADGGEDAEYYVYDGSGQRVRKLTHRYASDGQILNIKETLYLGAVEIRRTLQAKDSSSAIVISQYHALRISDGSSCIATRNYWVKGEPPAGFINPMLSYHLQDRLNSQTVEVDEQGAIISREEYYPYGGSALYQGSADSLTLKHYRYSGKERDSVTGFYYYGARYYAPWLCRWLSPDPAGTVDGLNIYIFVNGNPITYVDVGGMGKYTDGFYQQRQALMNSGKLTIEIEHPGSFDACFFLTGIWLYAIARPDGDVIKANEIMKQLNPHNNATMREYFLGLAKQKKDFFLDKASNKILHTEYVEKAEAIIAKTNNMKQEYKNWVNSLSFVGLTQAEEAQIMSEGDEKKNEIADYENLTDYYLSEANFYGKIFKDVNSQIGKLTKNFELEISGDRNKGIELNDMMQTRGIYQGYVSGSLGGHTYGVYLPQNKIRSTDPAYFFDSNFGIYRFDSSNTLVNKFLPHVQGLYVDELGITGSSTDKLDHFRIESQQQSSILIEEVICRYAS